MRRLLIPLAALGLVACGTTARLAPGSGAPAADGLAAPTATVGSTAATAGPAPVPDGPASAPQGQPTGISQPGAESTSAPDQTPSPALAATDHRPVEVGVIVEGSDSGLAGSFGFNGLNNGDEKATATALIADVNRHGGLAGHPITPVFYVVSASDSRSFSEIEQAACADFVQDHHVVAVIAGHFVASDNTLLACAKTVPIINSEVVYTGDAATFAAYPKYVAPAGLELERQARAYVRGMAAQGFFHAGIATGLVAVDVPSYRRVVSQVVIPELARVGVQLKDTAFFPETTSTSATSQSAAGIANAELRFAGDRIGQVLFLTDAGLAALEFMTTANTQHYTPRMALSTTDAPQAQEANAPATQLANVTGIGWAPLVDVDVGQEGASTPPRQAECLKLLTAAGQNESAQNTAFVAAGFCDEVWYLQMSATAAPRPVGSFPSVIVPSAYVDASRRDGVGAYRPFAFQASCHCFRYTGGPSPIPNS